MQAQANVAWQTSMAQLASALIGTEMMCRVVFSVVWEHMCQGKREGVDCLCFVGRMCCEFCHLNVPAKGATKMTVRHDLLVLFAMVS